MSSFRIHTNFNLDIDFETPAFHQRLFAWMIDVVLLIFYLLIASKALQAVQAQARMSDDNQYNFWAIGLVMILPFFLYPLICEVTMNGQSFGKKIMGIRVVSEQGGKPAISQYIIRWLIRTSDYTILIIIVYAPYAAFYGMQFFYALSGALAPLFIDVVLVNSRRQQRLGDILAHTVLVKTRQRMAIDDTVYQDVENDYTPVFPQVMRLSDHDINAVKSILESARRFNYLEMAEDATNRIKKHLGVETSLPAIEFLQTLLKDYNFLSAQ